MAEKPSKEQLYAIAEREIKARHQEEFQALVRELYEANGYVYRRRLSAEERAERERAAALARAKAKRAAAEAEIARLSTGKSTPVDEPGDGLDEFVGSQVKQAPFGAAHPVDPSAVSKAGLA